MSYSAAENLQISTTLPHCILAHILFCICVYSVTRLRQSVLRVGTGRRAAGCYGNHDVNLWIQHAIRSSERQISYWLRQPDVRGIGITRQCSMSVELFIKIAPKRLTIQQNDIESSREIAQCDSTYVTGLSEHLHFVPLPRYYSTVYMSILHF